MLGLFKYNPASTKYWKRGCMLLILFYKGPGSSRTNYQIICSNFRVLVLEEPLLGKEFDRPLHIFYQNLFLCLSELGLFHLLFEGAERTPQFRNFV